MEQMTYPPLLRPGDSIAIIAPATIVKKEYVDGAAEFLRRQGFNPLVMPHACGEPDGTYASSLKHRLDDFLTAWTMPEVKAVLCARGGYGAAHLLPHIPDSVIRLNPKWLIGFSDISALHALTLKNNIASIHGPMAKHLTLEGDDNLYSGLLLKAITTSDDTVIKWQSSPLDRQGECCGRIVGGNFAVLSGLAGTPFDVFKRSLSEDIILFLEDIAEPIYKVDRMLTGLYLSGTLTKLKGLVFGEFTEYKGDANFPTVEDMICQRLREWNVRDIPVAFHLPVGHISDNYPMVEGAMATLSVTSDENSLLMTRK